MRDSAAAHQIATRLRQMIQSGEVAAGTHLSAQSLASQFGVSRSPARQAMLALSGQGYLRQEANRGFFVRDAGAFTDELLDSVPFADHSPYQLFADDWLTDRIRPDVTEIELRDRYSLTKSQVTDMLLRAGREGWVEQKPGQGWRLLPVAKTPEAFEQIYRFRLMVEPDCLLEPGYSADRDVLARLRDEQQRTLDGGGVHISAERLLDIGSHFHEELIRLSGNPFAHMSLVRVNQMRRLLEYRARVNRTRLMQQCVDHLAILDLIEDGDMVNASATLRVHLEDALNRKAPVAKQWAGQTAIDY